MAGIDAPAEKLANERLVGCLIDSHQDDWQVPRNRVRPEVRLPQAVGRRRITVAKTGAREDYARRQPVEENDLVRADVQLL